MCTRLFTAIHWLLSWNRLSQKKHHIVVDRQVPAVINRLRRIPVSLKIEVNEELGRMVKMEIINPTEEPTD